jgi:hypothetical protein
MNENLNKIAREKKTWTKERIFSIVVVAVIYGLWFNFLDSAAYITESNQNITAGMMVGGKSDNEVYQPWNIIGHCIPGLILLAFFPKKFELFIASILISSAIMDSPLWGAAKLMHNLPLWYMVNGVNFVPTTIDFNGFLQWITYYYNPIGFYPVWEDNWPKDSGLPNAALIFWSVILRFIFAILLIYWQDRQERMNKEFSLLKKTLLILKLKNLKQAKV